jgi:hypothetical protein
VKLHTTFAEIKKHNPCTDGYKKLDKNLGGIAKYGRKTPITLMQILDSNGVQDAIWSLRCGMDEKFARLFACDCAERVLHLFEAKYPNDDRPRKAIEVAQRFANGDATTEELTAAWDAARDAARAAARDAAWDAARAAARGAAWDAARGAEQEWQAERLREMYAEVRLND